MIQTSKIDIVNIGLILLSLALALYVPFALFLFAYAVLGPLHYLTEINWLNKKDYFISVDRKLIIIPIILGGLLTIINVIAFYKNEISLIREWSQTASYQQVLMYTNNIVFIAFLFSVALAIFKDNRKALYTLPVLIILSVLCMKNDSTKILFGVFLPTIIHVYFFTGLFMLYGALKSGSKWGLVSFFLLMSVMLILVLDIPLPELTYNSEDLALYSTSNFHYVNYYIAEMFEDYNDGNPFALVSELGMRIQVFIAFAYTYHYLNWFTKTSVIKWHVMKTRSFVIILLLWVGSVVLYYVDYKMGLAALLYLSFLHVFLEFPLNYVSIKGIVQHLVKGKVRS